MLTPTCSASSPVAVLSVTGATCFGALTPTRSASSFAATPSGRHLGRRDLECLRRHGRPASSLLPRRHFGRLAWEHSRRHVQLVPPRPPRRHHRRPARERLPRRIRRAPSRLPRRLPWATCLGAPAPTRSPLRRHPELLGDTLASAYADTFARGRTYRRVSANPPVAAPSIPLATCSEVLTPYARLAPSRLPRQHRGRLALEHLRRHVRSLAAASSVPWATCLGAPLPTLPESPGAAASSTRFGSAYAGTFG